MKTQTKKRGRPVGSKTKLQKIESDVSKKTHELLSLIPARDYLRNQERDKAWEDFMIPTPKELGVHRGNNKMSLPNKITLVLTIVNVAILISLVIKNI